MSYEQKSLVQKSISFTSSSRLPVSLSRAQVLDSSCQWLRWRYRPRIMLCSSVLLRVLAWGEELAGQAGPTSKVPLNPWVHGVSKTDLHSHGPAETRLWPVSDSDGQTPLFAIRHPFAFPRPRILSVSHFVALCTLSHAVPHTMHAPSLHVRLKLSTAVASRRSSLASGPSTQAQSLHKVTYLP